jgi:uncharacterized membrane protein
MWKELLVATVLIPILDAPWLWFQSSASRSMFTKIQGGSPLVMRLWPALVVYIALGYLLLQQNSVLGAAIHGSAVYAVYDFTNLLVFKNYTVSFAIQDTIWGGVLFAVAFLLFDKIRAYI